MVLRSALFAFGGTVSRWPFRRLRQMANRHRVLIVVAAGSLLLPLDPLCGFLAPIRAATDETPSAEVTAKPMPRSDQSDFFAQIHRTLKIQHDRRLQIAEQARHHHAPFNLSDPDLSETRDQLVNQQITTMSASANYANAKLTREVAEIVVVEYTDGIFPQDLAAAEGELMLAQNKLDREQDAAAELDDQLAAIERASKGSIRDLAAEFAWHNKIAELQGRESKARLELEKAESKVKMMAKYAKPLGLCKMNAEVEAARAGAHQTSGLRGGKSQGKKTGCSCGAGVPCPELSRDISPRIGAR